MGASKSAKRRRERAVDRLESGQRDAGDQDSTASFDETPISFDPTDIAAPDGLSTLSIPSVALVATEMRSMPRSNHSYDPWYVQEWDVGDPEDDGDTWMATESVPSPDEIADRLRAYKKYVAFFAMSNTTAGLVYKFIDPTRLVQGPLRRFPCLCGHDVNDSSNASLLRHFTSWNGRHAKYVCRSMSPEEILDGIPTVLPLPAVHEGSIAVVSAVLKPLQWPLDFVNGLNPSLVSTGLSGSASSNDVTPAPSLSARDIAGLRTQGVTWRQA